MQRSYGTMVMLLLAALVVCCFATPQNSPAAEESQVDALRVGVTPNYPPMIFRVNEKITGLEADLARRLGKELDRPVRFVELAWDQQITALLEGKIDIIMSAMTITDARKVRINFTDPYLKSGLLATIRAGDSAKYNSVKSIVADFPGVGVIEGTTGEAYVRKNMSKSPRIVKLSKVSDAASELRSRRVDVFVYDAPAVVWLVSENEADLRVVRELFSEEYLGWGVRRDDPELRAKVNAALENWKKDGTLKDTVLRWLPYWKFD